MKKKLTAEEFGKLSDSRKELYTLKGDVYVLELEDDEDVSALKSAKEHEKQARKEAEQKARDLEKKLNDLTDEGSRKKGDVEALEVSWKKKLETVETEYKAKVEGLLTSQRKTVLDAAASGLATKISKVPSLLKKALLERMDVEFGDNGPTLRILDSAGKPSAMTLEDLEKEVLANKEFAPILIASKASGSGGREAQNAASGQNQMTDNKPLSRMSPKELADHLSAKKGE